LPESTVFMVAVTYSEVDLSHTEPAEGIILVWIIGAVPVSLFRPATYPAWGGPVFGKV